MFRWHEPPASARRVLLLGSAAAGLLALSVVALVVQNWDVGIAAGAVGLAAAADLWGDLRPRAFVLVGTDGLVVSTGRRTSVLAWSEVVGLRVEHRRFGHDRAVVERPDGTVVPLPHDVPLDEVERRRPDSSTEDGPGPAAPGVTG